jgi:hypothetical protein
VLGRNLEHRLEPELVELGHSGNRPLVIGLVHRKDDRQASLSDLAPDGLITARQPLLPIC